MTAFAWAAQLAFLWADVLAGPLVVSTVAQKAGAKAVRKAAQTADAKAVPLADEWAVLLVYASAVQWVAE